MLDGNAGTSFKTLCPGSIYNFGYLMYLVLMKYMQLWKYKRDSHSIIVCQKKEGENNASFHVGHSIPYLYLKSSWERNLKCEPS